MYVRSVKGYINVELRRTSYNRAKTLSSYVCEHETNCMEDNEDFARRRILYTIFRGKEYEHYHGQDQHNHMKKQKGCKEKIFDTIAWEKRRLE